uniref:Centromere/kinetochore protein zw10 n=1 Tax=Drosophila pseudoobscura pseudoobscura TaxID=46245 RepID=ZW10_DROPS|nr:RecName: Full=Centromere/kinetochore protein zw10; AltName: Full=Mitotic 15 protein [Drosophila pseudoobscura pseudoobscura]
MAARAQIKLLPEMFQSNGCASLEDTKSTVSKVQTRTERFQERVRKHIDENYSEFMTNHTSPDIFLEESSSLGREINDLLETVGTEGLAALNGSSTQLADHSRELRELMLGLQVSEHILKIDELFQCVEEAKGTKDYLVVLDLVGRLRSLIYGEGEAATQDVVRIFQALECYETIKVKYHVQAHLLQQNMQERFDRLVQLNCKSFPNSKCVTLLVSKEEGQLHDIVIALFQERYNPVRLCEFLLENCIEPLILKPVGVECNENAEAGTYVQLSLSYSTKESGTASGTSTQLRPNYKQVLEHFRLLLQTLSGINHSLSSSQHVFSIIGDHVKDRMMHLLVNDCLIPAVPETMEEYQASTLCEDVAHFEQYLADSFLINPEVDRGLSQFIEQYGTYYRNRLCSRVLESTREIIQRDLQDMVLVAPNNQAMDVTGCDPFLFPRCMVSRSAQDFMKLMERILRQPTEKPGEDEADPLAGVIGMMLQTYIDEVPKVHKKLLESIPQQSVLFHNNCMYFTHWVAQNANKGIESFPALVKTLQATGTMHFRVQVTYQTSILMDIMESFEFESPHTLGTGPLKLVRQCLRQLELLKNVWQNVLPDNVYNSTFVELLHAFINELVRHIFTQRDISATMASDLSDLIDVVLEKAPKLFRDPHEVHQVRSWMKLQQLKTMMNASLKEITELWCKGAGPLTANYKADEIRYLIRALFQDTDRRAKAITQIM